MYDEDGDEEPKCSFSTYVAEGEKLFNSGEYQKALDSYSTVSLHITLVVAKSMPMLSV